MTVIKRNLQLSILGLLILLLLRESDQLKRRKRALQFPPEGAGIGLFLAIAVPLDLPRRNVFVSYNFEFNYDLPDNLTATAEMIPPTWPVNEGEQKSEARSRTKRSLSRIQTYTALEKKFESQGFPGRPCLLRTICEVSELPITHEGVLGDILHVIFTPSSSKDENLTEEFYFAEDDGNEGDCSGYYDKCPRGILDLVSSVFSF